MIHYVKGDLLASDCDVIVHGCNCLNTFGAGIAKQIREQYPEANAADQRTVRGDKKKLGTIRVVPSNGRFIVNLYSQYDHGGLGRGGVYVDYDALENGMLELRTWAFQMDKWPKIGMPRIGCGLAGGEWDIVESIIDAVFTRDVYVYDFDPGR